MDRLLERLLSILGAARNASDLDELAELERETDEILVSGIANRHVNKADAHSMAALTLALDQVRRALRERRTDLEAHPVARLAIRAAPRS